VGIDQVNTFPPQKEHELNERRQEIVHPEGQNFQGALTAAALKKRARLAGKYYPVAAPVQLLGLKQRPHGLAGKMALFIDLNDGGQISGSFGPGSN
jgi:hypothetical protein